MSNKEVGEAVWGGAAMLAIVIVAALSLVGVIGYFLYLTPGPNDQI